MFQVWVSFIETSENCYTWASAHIQHLLPVCSLLRAFLGIGDRHKGVLWELKINVTSGQTGRKDLMVIFIS